MLFYSKPRLGNFGDDLNPWLWSKLAPEFCAAEGPALFLGIGTILSHKVPPEPIKVVFGSGCGQGPAPPIDGRWFIYALRGPLSAAKLKVDPALALTDPAILVRALDLPIPEKKFPISFMPHHQSLDEADWESLCSERGIHCINARHRVEQVLAELQQTKLLLAEAMHGAIVADALRVPWIALRLYPQFVEFKWQDWTQSLGVELQITTVSPVYTRKTISGKGLVQGSKKLLANAGLGKSKWAGLRMRASSRREICDSLDQLERVARENAPCLSPDPVIERLEGRLLERLGELRADWARGSFKMKS